MNKLLLALLALFILPAAFASRAEAQCVELKKGKALGAVSMGMTKAQLDKLGLKYAKGYTDGVHHYGPYQVWVKDGGGVTQMSIERKALSCLKVDGKKVDVRKAPLEELATLIGRCGPVQHNIGANVVDCADQIVLLESGRGERADMTVELRMSAGARDPELVCAAYVAPGLPGSKVSRVEVEEGKSYCVGSRVITDAVKNKDLTALDGKLRYNTCTRKEAVGALTVDCDFQGVRFVFAGPLGVLSRIEAIAIKQ